MRPPPTLPPPGDHDTWRRGICQPNTRARARLLTAILVTTASGWLHLGRHRPCDSPFRLFPNEILSLFLRHDRPLDCLTRQHMTQARFFNIGIGAASQRLIPTSERSGLLTHIATVNASLCARIAELEAASC